MKNTIRMTVVEWERTRIITATLRNDFVGGASGARYQETGKASG